MTHTLHPAVIRARSGSIFRICLPALLAAMFTLIMPAYGALPPVEAWEKTYLRGSNHTNNVLSKLDGAGNLILYSITNESSTATADHHLNVRKLDSAGNVLWNATYSPVGNNSSQYDLANELLVDSAGNVYACAGISNRLVLVKWNSAGVQQWVQSPTGGTGSGETMTLAGDGDIVIAGYNTGGLKSNYDILKYSPDGVLRWSVNVGMTTADFDVNKVGVDSEGNIFTAGWFRNANFDSSVLLVKHDAAGVELWRSTAGGASGGFSADEQANTLLIDSSGQCYVGAQWNGLGFGLLKYAADGTEMWRRTHNASPGICKSLAFDSSGNVITASMSDSGTFTSVTTVHARKYSPSGTLIWGAAIQGISNPMLQYPGELTMGADDSIYLTGLRYQPSKQNLFIAKFSNTGQQEWLVEKAHPTEASYSLYGHSIAVNSGGDVYVSGQIYLGSQNPSHQMLAVKYSPPPPPVVTMLAATAVADRGVTLQGKVNPSGSSATAYFEYGLTTAYGSTTPVQNIPVGSTDVNVSAEVTGLVAETIYHYRLVAIGGTTVNGADETVTTLAPLVPTIGPQPASQFAFLGTLLDLGATVRGSQPMALVWKKAGVVIKGATANPLRFTSLKATDAGRYKLTATNTLGTEDSIETVLGVVTRNPAALSLNVGAALTLNASVAVPTGLVPTFAWELNGAPLENGTLVSGGVVSGVGTKTLKISKVDASHSGPFTCRLTMTTPEGEVVGTTGNTQVTVVLKPVLDSIVLAPRFVGEVVNQTVTALNAATKFTATGLPPGILLHGATGVLSGKPTAAKVVKGAVVPYDVKFTASNSAGSSVVIPVSWTIQPLTPMSIGTFNGLVERSIALNPVADKTEGLGGTLRVVTASTGAVSGSLKLGTVTHALKGALITPPGGGDPTCQIVIPRKLPATNLTLAFTLNRSAGTLSGTVRDAATVPNSADVSGVLASKSAGLVGLYNSALLTQAPPGGMAYPQGTGFLTLNVTAAGTATWRGRLSDNTTITGSSSYGPAGQVPVHLLLYTNTGSAQGWAQITGSDVDGTLDWFKAVQPVKSTTRSYKSGFLRHNLTVEGGKYSKPATGSRAMGLPEGLQAILTDGGLSGQITQSITLTTGNVLQVPTNTNNVKVTLTAATGLFTGSFTQPGLTPTTPRKADLFGAFIPGSASGVGFFNLPENPDATGETPTNTPMHSGNVEVKAP
jgi:hypothetical protein